MRARIFGLLGIFGAVIMAAMVFPNYDAVGSQKLVERQPYAENILNASVQINMYALTDEIAEAGLPDKNLSAAQVQDYIAQGWGYTLGQGLGMVVNLGDRNVVVTHNHWGEMLLAADLAELLDYQGRAQASLTLNEFKSLTLFMDGGTMALEAPQGLNLPPAPVAQIESLIPGQRLLVARRNRADGKTVELVEAVVVSEQDFKGQPCWQLKTLDDEPIIPGDSGGGVWLDGALVGNNWARILEYDRWYWVRQALNMEAGDQVVMAARLPEEVPTLVTYDNQADEEANMLFQTGSRQERIEQ